jgi:hypothetical protein
MEGEDFFLEPIGGVTHIPIEDLILQTELRVAAAKGYNSYLCPCRSCHGGRRYHTDTIQQHLRNYGRDYFLNPLMLGGDLPGGFLEEGVWVDGIGEVLHGWNGRRRAHSGNSVDVSLDPKHDIQQQVYDAFAEGDHLRVETEHGGDVAEEDDIVADITAQLEKLDKLSAQASWSVYRDSSVSIVSATIVLINMSVIHGVSNAFMVYQMHSWCIKCIHGVSNAFMVSQMRSWTNCSST